MREITVQSIFGQEITVSPNALNADPAVSITVPRTNAVLSREGAKEVAAWFAEYFGFEVVRQDCPKYTVKDVK